LLVGVDVGVDDEDVFKGQPLGGLRHHVDTSTRLKPIVRGIPAS
jgi:hypothetical protein